MRSRRATHCAVLNWLLIGACTGAPQTPVPVVGSARDVRALAGQWEGWYTSTATGRNGSISFALAARGDSAVGDVVMVPRSSGRALQPWNQVPPPGSATPPHPSVLTINFVRVAAGRVTGTLAPYADPETGVKLFTRFEGTLAGDAIEGTYTTTSTGSVDSQTGLWQVSRRRGS